MTTIRVFLLVQITCLGCLLSGDEVQFNRDIRPILSDNCYYCHGPDEKTQEADLRLDTFDGATRDLGGYAAIVPGKPDESELIFRIEDQDDLMPPPKSKKTLTKDQIQLLRQWIKEGAKYEPHWSFMPLSKSEPPAVKQESWPKNPIDNYILSRLEEKAISPSPQADASTLIRRVYLDLTGLLPSPGELQQFLDDQRPDAFEHLVDRLLASPHYGERWGRHWLDQARYADSNGYSVDSLREMWPYRDWVIKAHNDDLPFDQFTIEQLAGDLLPEATKLQKIATGFHRNTLINQEGGTDREQFRVESAIDRVNTTGAVWLGLTVSCAQCHTHKFDPITHREYFEMYAFFNSGSDQNNGGKTLPVIKGEVFGNPVDLGPKSLSDKQRASLKAKWKAKEKARVDKLLAPQQASVPKWQTLEATSVKTSSDQDLEKQPGNSYLVKPGYGLKDSITFSAQSTLDKIGGIKLVTLPHKSLPKNGPGSAGNGNFVLTGFELYIDGKPIKFSSAFADHEQKDYPIAGALDPKSAEGWAINSGISGRPMNEAHQAVFVLHEPIEGIKGKSLEFRLHHKRNDNYLVGHFAINIASATPVAPQAELERLFIALTVPENKLSKAEKSFLDSKFYAVHPEAKKRPKSPLEANMMIMEDLPKPRDTYLLTRGDFTRPDKELGKLQPGGLSFVAPALPAKAGRNRLDLAKWLVDSQNPLTPRVTMNRMWMRYFGRGLVETEEDFGTQGALPSHPDLLDWLGRTFIEKDWSMKAMHRLIVTSATYRQQSYTREDLQEIDPNNYLLARQSRIRVDAELIRDSALCASGLLTREVGGPGFYPEQPDGVYAFTQSRKRWNASKGDDRYRRAMYTVFYRSAPYPLFTTFDAPDFSSVCTRRVKSNTPLQALTVANDPVFMEMARALALRIIRESPGATTEAMIQSAFQLCVSRAPSAEELEVLTRYVKAQEVAFEDVEAAEKFAGKDLKEAMGSVQKAASLVALARVMFNTDNFITRE